MEYSRSPHERDTEMSQYLASVFGKLPTLPKDIDNVLASLESRKTLLTTWMSEVQAIGLPAAVLMYANAILLCDNLSSILKVRRDLQHAPHDPLLTQVLDRIQSTGVL
jgi:hypothetical protein